MQQEATEKIGSLRIKNEDTDELLEECVEWISSIQSVKQKMMMSVKIIKFIQIRVKILMKAKKE